jgi:hypothetical protein
MLQQGQVFELRTRGPDRPLNLPLPCRWPRRETRAARRVRDRARDAREALERARDAPARAEVREIAHARRTSRGVPRPARRRTGDDRQAALAPREGSPGIRRKSLHSFVCTRGKRGADAVPPTRLPCGSCQGGPASRGFWSSPSPLRAGSLPMRSRTGLHYRTPMPAARTLPSEGTRTSPSARSFSRSAS